MKNAPSRFRVCAVASPDGFTARLAAYSATALGLAAVTAAARADTIVNLTAGSGTFTVSSNSDLTFSDGLGNLKFTGLFGFFGGFTAGRLGLAYGAVNGDQILKTATHGWAKKLGNGAAIASPGNFGNGAIVFNRQQQFPGGTYTIGNFQAPANGAVTGYVGFRHQANGHNYYGWFRIEVTADTNHYPATARLYDGGTGIYGAFDLTPDGTALTAGLTAIPEPATMAAGLGLFALGAAGLREHRRRRACAVRAG